MVKKNFVLVTCATACARLSQGAALREQTKIHIRSYTEIPITIFFHLHFLTSNPAILKAFPENFSTKMKP